MHTPNGATLMIPSVFFSWTGESLDKKIPLLRSNTAMDAAAHRVLTLMGETDIDTLNSSCGAEQEYFLIDANFANARPDLLLAGRTLFGAPSPKGQQFDDHYFGAIPARVQVFMQDFEDKLYRLGIPAKTHSAAMAHVSDLVGSISGAASIGVEIDTLIVTTIAGEANSLLAAVGALESALAVHDFETTEEHMRYCAGTLRGLMDQVRLHGDALGSGVADTYWPLPKYREMLFMK